MKSKMKRCFNVCLAVLLLNLVLPGQTGDDGRSAPRWQIGLGIETGMGSWILEDFDISKQSYDSLNENPGFDAYADNISSSSYYDLYLALSYNLSRSRKIGIGAGYQLYPGNTFEQGWNSLDTAAAQKIKVAATAVPIEIFYKIPLSRKVFFRFAAGIDLYRGKVDYEYTGDNMGERDEQSGRFNTTRVGAHFVYRCEIFLNPRLALTCRIGATICKFRNLTGTLADLEGNRTDALLVLAEESFGERLYHHPAAEPLPSTYQPAEVNISGLRLGFGLVYYLDL